VIVSDDHWMLRGCPVSGSSLIVGPEGKLRVVWYSGESSGPGLYWSESQDGGQTFSQRKLLGGGVVRGTPVLLQTGSGALAVWESNGGGTATTMVVRIEKIGESAASAVALNGELPSAASGADQLFIAYVTKRDDVRSVLLVRTQEK
jgi:hypothetical protein